MNVFYTNDDDGIWLGCQLCKAMINAGFDATVGDLNTFAENHRCKKRDSAAKVIYSAVIQARTEEGDTNEYFTVPASPQPRSYRITIEDIGPLESQGE